MVYAKLSIAKGSTPTRSLGGPYKSYWFHDRFFFAGVRMWHHEQPGVRRAFSRVYLASSRVINFSCSLLLGSAVGTLFM